MAYPEVIVNEEEKSLVENEREVLLAKIHELEEQLRSVGENPKTTGPITTRYKSWNSLVSRLQAEERRRGKEFFHGIKKDVDRSL